VFAAATMIRMTNHRVARRPLAAALCLTVLLAVPAIAHAAEPLERTTGAIEPITFELPEPTGRKNLGTTELHLVDPARDDLSAPGGKRELMVSVWYPARTGAREPIAKYMPAKTAAFTDAPWAEAFEQPVGTFDYANTLTHSRVGATIQYGRFPVVLFSPGYPYSRFQNTALVEDLASHGYVVVTMDHTHESPVEFPGERFLPGVTREPDAAAYQRAIATRVADARFVLSQLERLAAGQNPDVDGRRLPEGLGGALDLRKTGIFGFSAGGFTGAETMLADGRFAAGADLDGMLQYNLEEGPLGEVAKRGLDRPFLLFGSDTNQRTDPDKDFYDRSWPAFWEAQRGWKLDLQLPGSEHQAFSDNQVIFPQAMRAVYGEQPAGPMLIERIVGRVDPGRSVFAQRTYLAAFFDQTLKNRPRSLLRAESPRFPEVRFAR
jgi:dienelactone hydrolase